MENEAEVFHERQFRRIGMSEAYTPELKEKMQQGAPEIAYPYHKNIDGDPTDVLIHLKKYAALDAYEIKRFEISTQLTGQEVKRGQTFYIGELRKMYTDEGKLTYRQNRYTLKEAYNLLQGRPVHKQLISRDGQPFEAWARPNFNKKLANGNFELNFYTKNYGYHLENVLKEYPLKDLSNARYTISLIESLHRGNLQSTLFTPKGGEESKLFVSPSILTGSLNVYDANKKIIPTQQLVERNLISKNLGEKLLQSEKLRQEQKQEQKQDAAKENKQRQRVG